MRLCSYGRLATYFTLRSREEFFVISSAAKAISILGLYLRYFTNIRVR